MDPPGDPGGTLASNSFNILQVNDECDLSSVPAVAHNVVVEHDDSTVDTDYSGHQTSVNRKRASRRICRHCNRKRSKCDSKGNTVCQCQCEESGPNKALKINSSVHDPVSTNIFPNHPTQMESNDATPRFIGRHKYCDSDAAPYVIHIQKQIQASNDNTILHPISFGKFLKNYSIKNIVNGSLKRIGRNRLSLTFENFNAANNFMDLDILEKNKYRAFIPTFQVTRMGIVRNIPTEWSEEEIINNISVPLGCGKILKIRRLRRKITVNDNKTFIDTESVVITFDGQVLPKRVYMCFTSLPVDLYIYPTVQCFNCCRFGHVRAQCRSKPRCFKCGQDHTGDSCNVEEEHVSCCLCNGLHFAINKKCPEFERQRAIKQTMANSCVSYLEACKLHPPVYKSYADVLSSIPSDRKNHSTFHESIAPSPVIASKSPSSYKKTVFMKPRSPFKGDKGFDQRAHRNLTRDYDAPSPSNGCALKFNENSESPVAEIIIALINLLAPNNATPSNAADIIRQILNKTYNGSTNKKDDSVELSKYSK